MGHELAQYDTGDVGHGAAQPGSRAANYHAVPLPCHAVPLQSTMDLKKAVLEGSVFQSLVFHLKFAPWTVERFHKLDSKTLRKMLKLDAHYPAALLYMGLSEEGMGCVRLPDLMHTRKLSPIARCDKIGSKARGLMLITQGSTRDDWGIADT